MIPKFGWKETGEEPGSGHAEERSPAPFANAVGTLLSRWDRGDDGAMMVHEGLHLGAHEFCVEVCA